MKVKTERKFIIGMLCLLALLLHKYKPYGRTEVEKLLAEVLKAIILIVMYFINTLHSEVVIYCRREALLSSMLQNRHSFHYLCNWKTETYCLPTLQEILQSFTVDNIV